MKASTNNFKDINSLVRKLQIAVAYRWESMSVQGIIESGTVKSKILADVCLVVRTGFSKILNLFSRDEVYFLVSETPR